MPLPFKNGKMKRKDFKMESETQAIMKSVTEDMRGEAIKALGFDGVTRIKYKDIPYRLSVVGGKYYGEWANTLFETEEEIAEHLDFLKSLRLQMFHSYDFVSIEELLRRGYTIHAAMMAEIYVFVSTKALEEAREAEAAE